MLREIMMSERDERALSQLKSPRAAAINGILFSLLSMTVMFIVQDFVTVTPADISQEWLKTNSKAASRALLLTPFVGITFLWFTAVLRDWLVDWKDHFFSTVFFGSGILFVGMFFVWAAALGAVFDTYGVVGEKMANGDFLVFWYMFMNEILGDYTLRLMSVYMSSIATIWALTAVMPRWIIIITYILAIAFLLFAGPVSKIRFAFPCWVLFVSVYILVFSYRRTQTY
jgi:hypothetical protein